MAGGFFLARIDGRARRAYDRTAPRKENAMSRAARPLFVLAALLAALAFTLDVRVASRPPLASPAAVRPPSVAKLGPRPSRMPSTRDAQLSHQLLRLARKRPRIRPPPGPKKSGREGRRRAWFLRGRLKDAAAWDVVIGRAIVPAPRIEKPAW
jgi:hypothetical protein